MSLNESFSGAGAEFSGILKRKSHCPTRAIMHVQRSMSEYNERHSNEQKTEERSLLAKVFDFVPLLAVCLTAIELILKVLRIIR